MVNTSEIKIKDISQGETRNQKINILADFVTVWELNQNRDLNDPNTAEGLEKLKNFIKAQIIANSTPGFVGVPGVLIAFRHEGKVKFADGAMRYYASKSLAEELNTDSILAEVKFVESPYYVASAKMTEAEAAEKTRKAIAKLLTLQISSEGITKSDLDKFNIVSLLMGLGLEGKEIAEELSVSPPAISRYRAIYDSTDELLLTQFKNRMMSMTTAWKALKLGVTGEEIQAFYDLNGAADPTKGIAYPIVDKDVQIIANGKERYKAELEAYEAAKAAGLVTEDDELETEEDELETEVQEQQAEDDELETEVQEQQAEDDEQQQGNIAQAIENFKAPDKKPKSNKDKTVRSTTANDASSKAPKKPVQTTETRAASEQLGLENKRNRKRVYDAIDSLRSFFPSVTDLEHLQREGIKTVDLNDVPVDLLILINKFTSLLKSEK